MTLPMTPGVMPDFPLDRLLTDAAAGDRQAMDTIIRRYSRFVYGIAWRQTQNRDTAEDVAQAVFIVLAKRVGQVRPHALPAWLHQVTRYTVSNARRAAARRRKYETAAARPETAMAKPVSPDLSPLLDDAIAALKSGDRQMIVGKYLGDQDLSELAANLGITPKSAQKRLGRALERLRTQLEKLNRRDGAGRWPGKAALPAAAVTAVLATAADSSFAAESIAICHSASPEIVSLSQATLRQMAWSPVKKSAVAMAVLAAIAGGVMVGRTVQTPVSQPAQIARPHVTPVPPVLAVDPIPPSPVRMADLAPFVNDQTVLVARVDVSKIDLPALIAGVEKTCREAELPGPMVAMLLARLQSMSKQAQPILDGLNHANVKWASLVVNFQNGDVQADPHVMAIVDTPAPEDVLPWMPDRFAYVQRFGLSIFVPERDANYVDTIQPARRPDLPVTPGDPSNALLLVGCAVSPNAAARAFNANGRDPYGFSKNLSVFNNVQQVSLRVEGNADPLVTLRVRAKSAAVVREWIDSLKPGSMFSLLKTLPMKTEGETLLIDLRQADLLAVAKAYNRQLKAATQPLTR